MHIDPILPPLVAIIVAVLLLGLLLRRLQQPEIIGYLLAGTLIGPTGFSLISDSTIINHLGSLGVTMLLFFIGMEVSPNRLIQGWKVAVLGTLFQIVASVGVVWLIGQWFDWSLARIVLLGFVISLSSTAVVMKLLKDRNELDSPAGRNVVMILLAQDLAVVPMLIILSMLGGTLPDSGTVLLQLAGAAVIIGLVVTLAVRESIHIPWMNKFGNDHEMQVFAALLTCFGLALITGLLQLSTALGAFVAGMVVARANETEWFHHSLVPFRILFMAFFFVSVGMLINIDFVVQHWKQLSILVTVILVANTLINAVVLRFVNVAWRDGWLAGAMLAQIGEFSFILMAAGYQAQIITEYSYHITVASIAISLVVSASWIALVRKVTDKFCKPVAI